MRRRTLIVNGDDFGLHPAIDAGILAARERGILRSATLLATGPHAAEAVAAAAEVDLDIGLHLTLMDVPPAGDGAGLEELLDEGCFRPSHEVQSLLDIAAHRATVEAVEAEWAAQIERARGLGAQLTHLDSHNHVHLLPTLWPVAQRLAERFSIPALRSGSGGRGLKGRLISFSSALARRFTAPAARVAGPDRLLGTDRSGHLEEEPLLLMLARLPAGVSELMTHPGADQQVLEAAFPWGYGWARELAVLTSPRVLRSIERQGIELASYGLFGDG